MPRLLHVVLAARQLEGGAVLIPSPPHVPDVLDGHALHDLPRSARPAAVIRRSTMMRSIYIHSVQLGTESKPW